MVAVPALTPVTSPVPGLTLTVLCGLLQIPPGGVLANVTVLPSHTKSGPVMAVGSGFTVTGMVLRQPVGYV